MVNARCAIAFGAALTHGSGVATGRVLPRAVSTVVADSIYVALSTWGDARPRTELHRVLLTYVGDPNLRPRLHAATVLARADTFHTTLPARFELGLRPMELTLTGLDETPNLRFVVDMVSVGVDSVFRCIGEGRSIEVIRLPERSVLTRVDGTHPPRCSLAHR